MGSLLTKQYLMFISDSNDLNDLAEKELSYNVDLYGMTKKEKENALIEFIRTYDGDERDLMWWAGRFSLAYAMDEAGYVFYIPNHN